VIEASAVSYKVAAIVTKADNSQVVISDAGEHGILESGMLNITVSKYESTTSASISLNMKTGPEELTDVVCQ